MKLTIGIVITTLIIIVLAVMICIKIDKLEKNGQSAVLLFKSIDFSKLSKIESDYLTFGWDVIDTYSSRSSKDSMTKEQRISYLGHNKEIADAFGYGLYDVPIIHLLEGNFNPAPEHGLYNECGMGGFWYGTAVDYYNRAKKDMPERLWQYVNFGLSRPADLEDPINALKMTYIFLWIEYRNYKGNELWAISAYKWGRFMSYHWINNFEDSLFPERFIIKTKFGVQKFNPRAYYWTWRNMKMNFEKGCLAVGVWENWNKEQHELRAEQVEFRRIYSAFKEQEKIIKDLRQLKVILEKQLTAYTNSESHKMKVLNSIAGESRKTGIKKQWSKVKTLCKEWNKSLRQGVK